MNETRTLCEDCHGPFGAGRYARYCLKCRWKHRSKRVKYDWTPEREAYLRERYNGVKGNVIAIAAALAFPKWNVHRRAAALGLTKRPLTRRPWTAEEEAFLTEHLGSRHLNWICKKLGRSVASVALKVKRMKLSRAWKEGYTMRELELCFGVDHKEIDRWIKAGLLTGGRRGTNRVGNGGRPLGKGEAPADPWCFEDVDLLRFVTEYQMAFKLHRVDQFWFMDLITAGGVLRKALAVAKEDSAA